MLTRAWCTVVLVAASWITTSSAVDYSPVKPPSYPLAVRSPYLSGESSLLLYVDLSH